MTELFNTRPTIEQLAAEAGTSVSSVVRDIKKGLLTKLRDQAGRVSFDADQASDYVAKRRAKKAAQRALGEVA
jgi:predicted site-specific integrase-resolvase